MDAMALDMAIEHVILLAAGTAPWPQRPGGALCEETQNAVQLCIVAQGKTV